jgi:hypothetical protein
MLFPKSGIFPRRRLIPILAFQNIHIFYFIFNHVLQKKLEKNVIQNVDYF